MAELVAAAKKVAAVLAHSAPFPLVLALVVAVFLAAQDRIDRKDPKLALAPVDAEPMVTFE